MGLHTKPDLYVGGTPIARVQHLRVPTSRKSLFHSVPVFPSLSIHWACFVLLQAAGPLSSQPPNGGSSS